MNIVLRNILFAPHRHSEIWCVMLHIHCIYIRIYLLPLEFIEINHVSVFVLDCVWSDGGLTVWGVVVTSPGPRFRSPHTHHTSSLVVPCPFFFSVSLLWPKCSDRFIHRPPVLLLAIIKKQIAPPCWRNNKLSNIADRLLRLRPARWLLAHLILIFAC